MFSKVHFSLLVTIILIFSLGPRADAAEIHHNLGAGLGVPFGIVGISYEMEIELTDSFSIGPSLAGGTSVLAGRTSEVGLQLHFGDKNKRVRFGMSYWNGTNTIVKTGYLSYDSANGNTAGLKLRIQLGAKRNNCIDVHILRALTPSDAELKQRFGVSKKENDTLLGVGYVHRF